CEARPAVLVPRGRARRALPPPAVRMDAVGTAMRSRPSWDQWEALTTMASRDAGAQLWSRTDLKPADVDTAQLYDGFSFLTLAWIEALGFCGRGESGAFVEAGRLELGGALPTNTWGGQLSGRRLHGHRFRARALPRPAGRGGPRRGPGAPRAGVGDRRRADRRLHAPHPLTRPGAALRLAIAIVGFGRGVRRGVGWRIGGLYIVLAPGGLARGGDRGERVVQELLGDEARALVDVRHG